MGKRGKAKQQSPAAEACGVVGKQKSSKLKQPSGAKMEGTGNSKKKSLSPPKGATQPEVLSTEEWACPTCTFHNASAAGICEMCGTANPDSTTSTSSGTSEMWTCQACTMRNRPNAQVCHMCGTVNPTAKNVGVPATWTCHTCGSSVERAVWCGVCGSPHQAAILSRELGLLNGATTDEPELGLDCEALTELYRNKQYGLLSDKLQSLVQALTTEGIGLQSSFLLVTGRNSQRMAMQKKCEQFLPLLRDLLIDPETHAKEVAVVALQVLRHIMTNNTKIAGTKSDNETWVATIVQSLAKAVDIATKSPRMPELVLRQFIEEAIKLLGGISVQSNCTAQLVVESQGIDVLLHFMTNFESTNCHTSSLMTAAKLLEKILPLPPRSASGSTSQASVNKVSLWLQKRSTGLDYLLWHENDNVRQTLLRVLTAGAKVLVLEERDTGHRTPQCQEFIAGILQYLNMLTPEQYRHCGGAYELLNTMWKWNPPSLKLVFGANFIRKTIDILQSSIAGDTEAVSSPIVCFLADLAEVFFLAWAEEREGYGGTPGAELPSDDSAKAYFKALIDGTLPDFMFSEKLLLACLAAGASSELIQTLIKEGVDCNGEDESGLELPLVVAARYSCHDALKLLIDGGAKVNKKGKRGSPLAVAIENDRLDNVAALMDMGADLKVTGELHLRESDKPQISALLHLEPTKDSRRGRDLWVSSLKGLSENSHFFEAYQSDYSDESIEDSHYFNDSSGEEEELFPAFTVSDLIDELNAREPDSEDEEEDDDRMSYHGLEDEGEGAQVEDEHENRETDEGHGETNGSTAKRLKTTTTTTSSGALIPIGTKKARAKDHASLASTPKSIQDSQTAANNGTLSAGQPGSRHEGRDAGEMLCAGAKSSRESDARISERLDLSEEEKLQFMAVIMPPLFSCFSITRTEDLRESLVCLIITLLEQGTSYLLQIEEKALKQLLIDAIELVQVLRRNTWRKIRYPLHGLRVMAALVRLSGSRPEVNSEMQRRGLFHVGSTSPRNGLVDETRWRDAKALNQLMLFVQEHATSIGGCPSGLPKLRQISRAISSPNSGKRRQALIDFKKVLSSADGMTSYELVEGGFLEALDGLISVGDENECEEKSRFLWDEFVGLIGQDNLASGRSSAPCSRLVSLLDQIVSASILPQLLRELLRPGTGFVGAAGSGMESLFRPIRISLLAKKEESSEKKDVKGLSNTCLLLSPLTPLAQLERTLLRSCVIGDPELKRFFQAVVGSSILLKASPLLAEGVRVRPISELQSDGSREEKSTKEFGTVRGGKATIHLQGVWVEAQVVGYDESRCTHLVRLEAGKELFSVRLILMEYLLLEKGNLAKAVPVSPEQQRVKQQVHQNGQPTFSAAKVKSAPIQTKGGKRKRKADELSRISEENSIAEAEATPTPSPPPPAWIALSRPGLGSKVWVKGGRLPSSSKRALNELYWAGVLVSIPQDSAVLVQTGNGDMHRVAVEDLYRVEVEPSTVTDNAQTRRERCGLQDEERNSLERVLARYRKVVWQPPQLRFRYALGPDQKSTLEHRVTSEHNDPHLSEFTLPSFIEDALHELFKSRVNPVDPSPSSHLSKEKIKGKSSARRPHKKQKRLKKEDATEDKGSSHRDCGKGRRLKEAVYFFSFCDNDTKDEMSWTGFLLYFKSLCFVRKKMMDALDILTLAGVKEPMMSNFSAHVRKEMADRAEEKASPPSFAEFTNDSTVYSALRHLLRDQDNSHISLQQRGDITLTYTLRFEQMRRLRTEQDGVASSVSIAKEEGPRVVRFHRYEMISQIVSSTANLQMKFLNETGRRCMRLLYVLHRVDSRECVEGEPEENERQNSRWALSDLGRLVGSALRNSLLVGTGALPDWVVTLVETFPFLLDDPVRELYVKMTAFGTRRTLRFLQQLTPKKKRQNNLIHIPKEKAMVDRQTLFLSAERLMEAKASSRNILEIIFKGEKGYGSGVTASFFSAVAEELQKKLLPGDLRLWIDADVAEDTVAHPNGLFPRPVLEGDPRLPSIVKYFRLIGRMVGRALMDERIFPLGLSPYFLALVRGDHFVLADAPRIYLEAGRHIWKLADAVQARGHAAEIDGMPLATFLQAVDFSFIDPLTQAELVPGGLDKEVTPTNVRDFLSAVARFWFHEGIAPQVAAFRSGLNDVLPLQRVLVLRPKLLSQMISGDSDIQWTESSLKREMIASHGFDSSSAPFLSLVSVLAEMTVQERRSFLLFATGCPNLPPGGLSALSPPFEVSRRVGTGKDADTDLPFARTCTNTLHLPPYSSKEVLARQLKYAIASSKGVIDRD